MSEVYFEDYSWYIKIIDGYGNTKYLEVDIDEEISSVCDVFKIMSGKIPYGYVIADEYNLYTLQDIPCEYWAKSQDLEEYCFQHVSESDWGYKDIRENSDISYFDKIIEIF